MKAFVLFTLACLANLAHAAAPSQQLFAADGQLAAVYRDGALHVTVPFDGRTSRPAKLDLEVLDPNDKPVAHRTGIFAAGRGRSSWNVIVPVGKAVSLEDLAWHRLKIDAGNRSKIVSISEILRLPVVRLFAQRSYAAGSHASARIIATNSKTGRPLRGSVAIGHPFGATGARILSQSLKQLAAMPSGSRAVVSICADGGVGTVALLQT